ncbi:MAG: SUF system NifU family Fe-S cluster assembly protein [Puniceicoccales bacterium]|jgi:nitrogen fixation NifU-like protein|nr:SUF system NifU family Fe-S cluster assembly protein [Puniceicoccales bacterium]
MNLQDIYQEILLAHNENPNHFESMSDATHQSYGNNPLCGDEITIFVKIENDIVKAVSFTGEGCAICKASSSLMTDTLCGLSLSDAVDKTQKFIQLLSDESIQVPNDLGELEALLGVRKFPARLKCATLAWHTFLKATADEHR